MRKFLIVFSFAVFFAVIFSGQKMYAASASPNLYLNGTKLNPPQPPTIVNGTTFVPVRVISESLGYRVDYNKASRKILIKSDEKSLTLSLDSAVALIDNRKVNMPSKPLIVKGYSMLPLRFIAEQFGLQVSWDAKSRSVLLVNPVVTPPSNAPGKNVIQNIVMSPDNSITLSYLGDVTYSTMYLQNPDRIVIDVPNASLDNGFNGFVNSNDPTTFTGSIAVNNPLVSQIRYGLYDDKTSTIRFVLDMASSAAISGVQNKEQKQIVFTLKPSDTVPTPKPSRKFKVVIDAGHGGKDPGAISASRSKMEKTFTLAIATKVQALLSKDSNIEVIMTRSGDTYPTLTDRTNLANGVNADVFVSIHANAASSAAHGSEVFYLHQNSKELAQIMHNNIQAMVGFYDRGVKTANFHVIRETNMPAVLLEMGFISNPDEEKKLFNDSVQQTMAEAIAVSIKQFLKL
ncbi:AMIN domain-containing protein [Cohnella pontilimi]|uniref:AMIN domain-containing protein n=1 Tax=Cohnella pontilimi TaxID=2564100 RepID=A0A4U0FDA9_9BACL|nr:N-acetylmuramoyl-L-alanine amidase family protein [Cohnella pontilimi]TJY42906.1 AMIN domain-containing protein [Cohnella pontilimi]